MRFSGIIDPRLIQPGHLTQIANARMESKSREHRPKRKQLAGYHGSFSAFYRSKVAQNRVEG